MMSLTHVGKYCICTRSRQPEYSTVHSFRENHTSVFFSAIYNFFQSLPWIYRELQWSMGAEHPSLSLDDVTRALCQSFHGLKKVHAWGQWHVKICKPKCSTQAYRASLCMFVCVWEWVSVWGCLGGGQEFLRNRFVRKSKVLKAAMLSHAKILFFNFFFLFG